MPRSHGSVKLLRYGNHFGDVQAGDDDAYHTFVYDDRDPYRTGRLLGPHASVAQASKAFRKYVDASGAGKRKQYKRRAKAYASR